MASDWTYIGVITKLAVDIAAKNNLLISRRGGWALFSESKANKLGITRQKGVIDRWFVTKNEIIHPKHEHGPLICDGGEIADDDYIRMHYRSQGTK